MLSRHTALALPALLLAGIAPITGQAQTVTHGAQRHGPNDDEDEIVVSGHLPVDMGLLAGTASLEDDALLSEMKGQIGEVLARLPGVSSTSFSPGASRPVLRGLDGDRVRVLIDGVGTVDASSVSADHAVVLDPLVTDHIDVVHGPGVLLFGGQAIGGAVNVLDKRIPRAIPETPHTVGIATYGSAADERYLGASLDVPLASRLVLHVDGSWRKSGDVRVPGFVVDDRLRADLLADAADHRAAGELDEAGELEDQAGLAARVPNSAARTATLGAGLAFIDAGGSIGVSIQHTDSRYGVPMRPGAGHAHGGDADEEPAPVTIVLAQTRIDLRAELKLSGWFESMNLRGAYGDYNHVEMEGNEEGTRFVGNGVEFRADLLQAESGGWRGHSGIQFQSRSLNIDGPEANTPDNITHRVGLFTLQSLALGHGWEVQASGRYERATVIARSAGFESSFDLWSGAAGLSWQPVPALKLGANFIHGARAPAPEELLSDGMHVATQSYELGDRSFTAETSNGVEAYIRYHGEGASLSLTGYHTRFPRFIASLPTGAEQDGLPVFAYRQQAATFKGFEAEGSLRLAQLGERKLTVDAAVDYTHASLGTGGPVPRIPPLRVRGGIALDAPDLNLRGEVEWNAAQNRVPAFERTVAGFAMVNLSADWHPMGEHGPLTLILAANNLLDQTGRRAASYTREFVPLAGRDVRLTAKVEF